MVVKALLLQNSQLFFRVTLSLFLEAGKESVTSLVYSQYLPTYIWGVKTGARANYIAEPFLKAFGMHVFQVG